MRGKQLQNFRSAGFQVSAPPRCRHRKFTSMSTFAVNPRKTEILKTWAEIDAGQQTPEFQVGRFLDFQKFGPNPPRWIAKKLVDLAQLTLEDPMRAMYTGNM